MRPIFIALITILVVTQSAVCQNKLTFQNDLIYLSQFQGGAYSTPSPFFIRGWYGSRGDNPQNFRTKEGYISGLIEARANGANVTIDYFNRIIDTFLPSFHDQCWTCYSYDSLSVALEIYLDEMQAIDMKAIVHLPTHYVADCSFRFDVHEIDKILSNSYIVNHPALIGWYQADEPELDILNNCHVNYEAVTYDYLRDRYERIKFFNTNHPVFVVFVNNLMFRDQFTQDMLDQTVSYRGPIFDVLMADLYPVSKSTYSIPHPDLNLIIWQTMMLREVFMLEKPQNNQGAMIFIHQGTGERNILAEDNPWDKRNLSHLELLYATNASLVRSQVTSELDRNQLSGVLYWDMSYSDVEMTETVNDIMRFYNDNNLFYWQTVSSESSDYSLVEFLNGANGNGSQWWLNYQVKKEGNTIFISTINQCNNHNGFCSFPTTNNTLRINSEVSLVEQLQPVEMSGNQQLAYTYSAGMNRSYIDLSPYGPNETRFFIITLSESIPDCPNPEIVCIPSGKFTIQNVNTYPNPFNPHSVISFTLSNSTEVEIRLYNIVGQFVKSIHRGSLSQGYHTYQIDGTQLSSGIYIINITASGEHHSKIISLIK